jgi:hypothetical protein
MKDITASDSPTDLAFEQNQTQQAAAAINTLSRGKWARRVTESWQKQVPSIFEVAALLESAQAELRKRDWTAMVRNDLPFSRSTATKLVKIAKCDHLRNSDHGPNLPACWRTLYEMTLLTPQQFEHGIKIGIIGPKTKRAHIKALREGNTGGSGTNQPTLKQQLADAQREISQLKSKLRADGGSLFDPLKDTAKDIADVVVSTFTEAKARAIADAIKSAIKAKKTEEVA